MATAILMLSGGTSFVAADSATLGGNAQALVINSLIGSSSFGSTGQLPTTGGELDAAPAVVTTAVASAEILMSYTTGSGSQAESQSALGYVALFQGTPYQVTTDFATSKVVSTCTGSYGSAELDNLGVAGQAIAVTGAPNQQFSIPGLVSVVIDEQINTVNGIQVNALDVSLPDGTQVLVGSAASSASCSPVSGLGIFSAHPVFAHGVPSTPGCIDFTTGGGWIVPPAPYSGAKATFGFVAGYKPGGVNPRGSFEYHDHGFGYNIHSEDVLFYNCGPYSNSRVFGGDAELNQAKGYCYEVYAQDNGEPGKGNDYLSVWLWSSSVFGGDCSLVPACGSTCPAAIYADGNYLGGGNIEIHMH